MRSFKELKQREFLNLISIVIGGGLTLTACGSSEAKKINSSPAPTPAISKNIMVGTEATPTPAIATTTTAGTPTPSYEEQSAIRRKEEFAQDMEKLKAEQEFKASEADKDRSLKKSQQMADLIPVLAMTAAFTQLTDKMAGKNCAPSGNSTYKSLLSDSQSIIDKASSTPPAAMGTEADAKTQTGAR